MLKQNSSLTDKCYQPMRSETISSQTIDKAFNHKGSGLKVTTSPIAPKTFSKQASETYNYDLDPSFMAQRYQKMTNKVDSEFSSYQKTTSNNEKKLMERLNLLKNVRLSKFLFTKKLRNGDSSDRIKFQIEDADDNLDMLPNDEEVLDLEMLRFQVSLSSLALNITIRQKEQLIKTKENQSFKSVQEQDRGFEMDSFSPLKNRQFAVRFTTENGETPIWGRIEYKSVKCSIYDPDKKLLYNLDKSKRTNAGSDNISIKNTEGKQIGSGLVTMEEPSYLKYELELPHEIIPIEKLLIICGLLTLMEREPLKGVSQNDGLNKGLKASLWAFLKCTNN